MLARIARRAVSGMAPLPGDASERLVTVIPGEGIGPELCSAAMRVLGASGAPLKFEIVQGTSKQHDAVLKSSIESVQRTRVALMGEFAVGIGRGTKPALHIELNKALGLYANVVRSHNLPGVSSRHDNLNIVVIRENTEGEYSGMEHEVVPGVAESLKVMSREGTMRIAEYAFEYAFLNLRKKVTAVHKANIMKRADGLFLESCREVAKRFPQIQYEEVIVDNCMMQLVSKPSQYDVMVTPNLYGSLVSNTVAGLVGGPALAPGANIGRTAAVFEQGARHVGNDIAGRGIANPTGMLLASAMMLRHVRLPAFADRIQSSVFEVLKEGKSVTKDVGGSSSTTEFVDAVIAKLATR